MGQASIIPAAVFVALSTATYGPDWQIHVAEKFHVTGELVGDLWGKKGAPFYVIVLIRLDFNLRRRETVVAENLFPVAPPKPEPSRH